MQLSAAIAVDVLCSAVALEQQVGVSPVPLVLHVCVETAPWPEELGALAKRAGRVAPPSSGGSGQKTVTLVAVLRLCHQL